MLELIPEFSYDMTDMVFYFRLPYIGLHMDKK